MTLNEETADADRWDDPESLLTRLLTEHPDATTFAIQRDDWGRPDPNHPGLAGLPIDPAQIVGPMDALEMLHPTSMPLAISALDRIADRGVLLDELFLADGAPVDSYFVDTTATRKLYMGVLLSAPRRAPLAEERSTATSVPSRVVRMRTDGLGRVAWIDDEQQRASIEVGQLSLETIHPADLDDLRSVWASMLAHPGVAHRCRYRATVEGRWAWHEASITSHLDNPADGMVHLEIIDITSEMEAHEEVRRRERTLHRLAEALPQAVVQLDHDGRAVYANGRAHSLLGTDLDHLRPMVDAASDDDRELFATALVEAHAGADHDIEIQLVRPSDGQPMVAEVALRALAADDGEPDGVMCCITDVTERARLRANLEQRATFDQLTGVHNRGSLMRALAMALHPHRSGGVAVVFVDLDRFKQVNDQFGHEAGDEVLRTVASQLASAVRANDVVGRLGGDEFVVVCPDVADSAAAEAAALRIAASLDPLEVPGLHGVQASIGVAWSDAAVGPSDLMSRADAAMYESKRGGTGSVVVADE